MSDSQDLLSGYLRKKSPKRVLGYPYWQRRFFTLDTQAIKYFKTDQARETQDVRGILPLALIVSAKTRATVPERFDLILKDTDRVFHFIADTPQEARKWTQAIEKQLDRAAGPSERVSPIVLASPVSTPSRSGIENKLPKRSASGSSSSLMKRNSESLTKKGGGSQKYWKPKRNTFSAGSNTAPAGVLRKARSLYDNAGMAIRKKDILPLTVSSDNPYLRDTGVLMKDQAVRAKLKEWCSRSTPFKPLSKDVMDKVIDRMWCVKITKESEILSQGQRASEFCVIGGGAVSVMEESLTGGSLDNKRVTAMPVGHSWGELALMYETRSIATYTAAEGTILWVIDGRTFQAVVSDAARSQNEMKERFLKTIDLFAGFTDSQYSKLADELIEEVFEPGTVIIEQGKEGNKFFLLQSGEALVTKLKPGHTEAGHIWTYRDGGYFGELALLTKNERAATITARTECQCLSLERKWFYEILGPIEGKLRERSEEYKKTRNPDGDAPIKSPHSEKVASPVSTSRPSALSSPNITGTPQGSGASTSAKKSGPRFHMSGDSPSSSLGSSNGLSASPAVPAAGSHGKPKGGPRFHLPGSESASPPLSSASPPVHSNDKIPSEIGKTDDAEDPGVRLQFMQEVSDTDEGEYTSDSEGESEEGKKVSQGKVGSPGKNRKRVSDFRVIGTLGKGSFGHVQLVEDSSKVTYALKSVSKAHLVKHGQQSHILSEKQVMEQLNHPFIVRLCGTFQDKNCLHFLMEPSLGGELFSLMRKNRILPEPAAKFYAGCVILAFEYMHSKNILYRDLKPENLLLGEDGFLKITDYGFAIQTPGRTYTMCGTPDYLAPEMIACKGHGKGVDWWTVGIFIYEMLAGKTPFADNRGPNKIYDKIMAGNLEFPPFMSREVISLIRGLLEAKPTHRLGVLSGGAALIKDHPWFRGFNWDKLFAKEIAPPYKKRIKHRYDLGNFDFYPEETIFEEYDGDSSWCRDF
eukprot:gb/GEZN01001486.1/.p1 GENE.gb/GEZN01001486.1/~~gb/GEZN01001486.1/.p1  ORF type:complete len:977 (+),score=118.13 gb/GEZN01001486.1/:62-2992(+)